jgi:hypothetical protein
VASTRLPNTDRTGCSSQGERVRRASVMARADLRRPATANDNAAPLLRRVQRFLFTVTAALALAWMFWVGFLR